MPKRNDGNEQDLRIRPQLDATPLASDNPMTYTSPDGKDPCEDGFGNQVDLPKTNPCDIIVDTPSGTNPPIYDWLDVSKVCPRGFDTRALDNLFMAILKNHFVSANNICRDNLKGFVYSPDPAENKIRIVMNTSFDSAESGLLPAIVVKRGRQRFQRIVMGDSGKRVISEGTTAYSRFAQGSHRILCMAGQDGVTEDLSNEVFDLFNSLSPIIRTDLPMHDFQVTDQSELGILEDLGQSLAVAIECIYTYEYSWTIRRTAPTLRGNRVQANTTLLGVEGEG